MHLPNKALRLGLAAALAGLIAGPGAQADAKTRIHSAGKTHIRVDVHLHPAGYPYGYIPGYVYGYMPARVFRCYPARLQVEDQVGLIVGHVPLGTCG
jgi:hypothetical protein